MNWAEMIFARMKRGAHRLTTVGSATQLYTPLPFVVSRDYIVVGSAVGQNYQLPDARQCEPECTIQIKNSSSEFIGICASGSTTMIHRIPPRGVGEYVLVTAGTAAGVWYYGVEIPIISGTRCYVHDFQATGGTTEGWNPVNSGAGTLCEMSGPNIIAAQQTDGYGGAGLRTGSTDTGYALYYKGARSSALTNGPYSFEYVCRLTTGVPVAGVDDAIYRLGLGNNIVGAAPTNGMWAEVDLTNAAPLNWHLCNADNGAVTEAASGVDCTTAATKLTLERSRAGDRSDLFIDGVWRCTAGGLPTAIGRSAGPFFGVTAVKYTAISKTLTVARSIEIFAPAVDL